MMKPVKLSGIILILLAMAYLAGCRGGKISLKDLMGPSPKEMVKMAFDPTDADRRREGVTLLSHESFGLREPYLKAYATLARTDSDASVRSAAILALGKAGDRKYLPVIVNALEDESSEVRWDAADALGVMTGPSALAPLRKHALDDGSVDVRLACVRALRCYRKQDVVETLIDCLADRDFSVCYEAHKSLVILTGLDRGYDPVDWRRPAVIVLSSPTAKKAYPRPWWDWMGLGNKSSAPAEKTAAEPTTKKAPSRPWWDWMGLGNKSSAPVKKTAAEPTTKKAASRSWWDWMGLGNKSFAPVKKTATEPTAKKAPSRPWWDWMGLGNKSFAPVKKTATEPAAKKAAGGREKGGR